MILRAVRFRPLLPIAAVTVWGQCSGFALARTTDTQWLRFWPEALLPTLLCCGLLGALLANRWRPRALPLLWVCIALLAAGHAARRMVPPHNDLAHLVRQKPDAQLPQRRLQLTLRGCVAGAPRIGDFGIEFPMQVERVLDSRQTALQGRVWTRLPLPPLGVHSRALQAGDKIEIQAQLADLPRAGHAAEREQQARMVAQGCWCIARVREYSDWKLVESASSWRLNFPCRGAATRHSNALQQGILDLGRPYPHATAQLLTALVFGEGGLRQPLPQATRERFRDAGMSHVLVASGTQVAFGAACLLFLARGTGARRLHLPLLILLPLLLYALLAGGGSSIWRATIAGVLVAVAMGLGRDVDGLSLWSLALVTLLWLDPMQGQSIGFQLTFAATWGLLVVAPALQTTLHRVLGQGWLSATAALTLGAQLATTPILLYHFGRASAPALGTNFAAIPLAGLLVVTGTLGLVLPLASLNYHLVHLLDSVATLGAELPGAQSEAAPLRLGWTLALYACIFIFVLSTHMSTRSLFSDRELRRSAWQSFRSRFSRRFQNWRPQGAICSALLIACAVEPVAYFSCAPARLTGGAA
jgi:competence protein ComEC